MCFVTYLVKERFGLYQYRYISGLFGSDCSDSEDMRQFSECVGVAIVIILVTLLLDILRTKSCH